jgi:serine/tyrosine/threonine adenylyltransferase
MNSPRLIGYSEVLANELGVDLKSTPEFDLGLLSGNNVPLNAKPFALCYGGHKFGNWTGQLGDGRAITLGDFDDPAGNKWEFQLKGSGLTPYSRGADGKAVLRSSIREFLASEAMYALGVPTTRALSLVTTGEMVMRDMFYDGNPKAEKGAIVSRLAPSFLRFGNFEILAAQNDLKLLEELINWSIEFHFKDLLRLDQKERHVRWFKTICRMTAELMCEWLRVGFVHGVMNTDNMSILGLTIDYGPFGFLEEYDPSWTPNTTDLP